MAFFGIFSPFPPLLSETFFVKSVDKAPAGCYNKFMKRKVIKHYYNDLIINQGNITHYNTTADELNVSIVRCGHQGGSVHSFKDINAFHVLQYCTKGKGTFILQDNEYPIEKGTLFYLPMNVRVRYFSDKEDPYDYYWICFNGDSAKKLLHMSGLTTNTPCVQIEDEKMEALFRHTFEVMSEKKSYANCALLSDLFAIFDILIEHKTKNANLQLRSPSDIIENAITYMERNFQYGISITDVCNELSIHPSNFSTLFTKQIGCSPVKYLMGLRVEHASLLLRTTNLSISEIALLVGVSPLVLTSIFKKRTNKTPREYRNDNKTIDIT